MKWKGSLIGALCVAFVMAGCATLGPGSVESFEQPVSRQTPTSDALNRARIHTELGMLYYQEGRYEVALEEARIALDASGGYAPAYNLQGLVYMTLRQNARAEESFRRALGAARGDPEINNDYGWFLCQSGKVKESLAYFQVAINNPLFPSVGLALTRAGICATKAGNDRQAEEYLLAALRMDRRSLPAQYWLADIAYRGNRLPEAQQRMKDLHAQLPEPTAESAWLALRIDRKLGDREGEARQRGVLGRKYRDSEQYQKVLRGEFD